jgi:hypothetical protein
LADALAQPVLLKALRVRGIEALPEAKNNRLSLNRLHDIHDENPVGGVLFSGDFQDPRNSGIVVSAPVSIIYSSI